MLIDKYVLIVDDYKIMLEAIRNLPNQIDFHSGEEATGGARALAKPRAGKFGLASFD